MKEVVVVIALLAMCGTAAWTQNVNHPNTINGCDPIGEFFAVQYKIDTEALTGCAKGLDNMATHQITGVAGFATSSNSGAPDAVGVYSQARALVDGAHAFGGNDVSQDISGLASGVQLVGREIDVQPYNAPSSYNGGIGLNVMLYNNNYRRNGCTLAAVCNYRFSAIQIGSGPAAGGQTWNRGIYVPSGAIGKGEALYVEPTVLRATSSANYGSPGLWSIFDTGWNGKAAFSNHWSAGLKIAAGINPVYDAFYNQIVGPANNVPLHHFSLSGYQNMDLCFAHSNATFGCLRDNPTATANSTWTPPASTGVLPVLVAPVTNAIPLISSASGSTTDASLTPSHLRDSGTQLVSSEPLLAASFLMPLTTPKSSSAPCTPGQFANDENYYYVCTAPNTWKRAALTSF